MNHRAIEDNALTSPRADRSFRAAPTSQAAANQTSGTHPDILECVGILAGDASAAVRFKIYDADHQASVAALRDAMGDSDFDSA